MKLKYRSIFAILLAAMYAALVVILQSISFGPIQIRIADMLSPITYVTGFEGVIGLTMGTLIANMVSPYGVWDMAIGTLCTLTYSLVNYVIGRVVGYRKWMLPIIAVIDAVIVGVYIGVILLTYIFNVFSNPIIGFLLLTGGDLVPTIIGSLIIVPLVRRYITLRML